MRTIYEPAVCSSIIERIERLSPGSQRQWGTMDVSQMLAHCNETMKVVTDRSVTKRTLLGRLLGPLFRAEYLGEKPLRRNSPTNPMFVITDEREFLREKEMLLRLVRQFSEGGEANCTKQPHSFFGRFTPAEWGISTYKHLDHHLQQFGV
jgi:hypothetical protein